MFDLRKSLVVCSTSEKEFSRVFDLRIVWSCVRPEKEFGRVFDLRKSLVVCST